MTSSFSKDIFCKPLLVLCVFLFAGTAQSALPPSAQNLSDLHQMVRFVEQHKLIAETLNSINLDEKTVYYMGGCKAYFERNAVVRPPGWVGPSPALKFSHSTCRIKYQE